MIIFLPRKSSLGLNFGDQQFTSERFESIYQESCYAVLCQGASYQPGLSTLHLDKKHLRSVIIFLDVTVNQVGSQHELLTSEKQRAERSENMFLLFTNVSVRVHLSKTL